MQDAAVFGARQQGVGRAPRRARVRAAARAFAPSRAQSALAALSALLVVLSFPDFELWPLAWVGLVPLMLAVPRARPAQAFALGWLWGVLFFYGSCWWLTHSMIHYGRIPAPLAFALLLPPVILVGLFPALWALAIARASLRWGAKSLALAPFAWAALEWLRLTATGQLWNALGYSQAYQPTLIQPAAWGGVYAVSFLLVTTNAAVAFAFARQSIRAALVAAGVALLVTLTIGVAEIKNTFDVRPPESDGVETAAAVVAIQPNVSPNFERSAEEERTLVARHLSMSASALREWEATLARAKAQGRDSEEANRAHEAWELLPRLVVWPESPMNFRWERDAEFREIVSNFARANRTSVLFNALEPAPAGGGYNSAVLVNERGELVARYDKIRLLPFGEYVPLPRWLGGGFISAIVGEFTPGASYTLLPAGDAKAGVFICFESAFPALSREFTNAGADVLINISNDGYLGRTPVLRQHLANAVFRAAENRREVLRVTNTGITARITPRGEVLDATAGFETAARTWAVTRAAGGQTFYTRRGDLFVALCAALSAAALVGTVWKGGKTLNVGASSQMKRSAVVIFGSLLSAALVAAQDSVKKGETPPGRPDLSGSWVLTKQKSDFLGGPGPAPADASKMVDEKEKRLRYRDKIPYETGVPASDGSPYRPDETLTIAHNDPQVRITKKETWGGKPRVQERLLHSDARPVTKTVDGSTLVAKTEWDGKKLFTTLTATPPATQGDRAPKTKVTSTESWEMSKRGDTLTQTTTTHDRSGRPWWRVTRVFKRAQ